MSTKMASTSDGTLARIRLGGLALGLAALLLAVFPIVRPYFDLDPRAPTESMASASPVVTSAAWVTAHLLCTLAFVLLPFGLLALHARLASVPAHGRSLAALVSSLAGIALILPMLGVETYVLPILGTLYQAGLRGVAPAIGMIYLGPALWVFLLGLVLLAAGAIAFAVVIWRSGVLPRWAGVLLAVGLSLWFPPLPRAIRVVDGLVIGVGGLWLAASLGRETPPPPSSR